jgi:transcriptional regulator NrdR family protein
MIHTRDLEWGDLRYIFFPSKLERYGYLGITFYKEDSEYYKAIYPLVLAMDYEAKPYWCPRWFLRFLHVFGNDKSIVRVRNRRLSNLHRKLTKGIQFWDWKTKWSHYDLRISISATQHLQELARYIEDGFYSRGRQKELVEQIKKIDPNAYIIWGSIERLEKQLEELEEKLDNKEQ